MKRLIRVIQYHRSYTGFTLIELIVAIGLSALVLAGLTAIFSGTLTVWSRVQNSGTALREARLAMQWLTKDIREKHITSSGGNSIEFADGTKYYLNEENLKRNTDLVAEGITKLDFTYNDSQDIRFVSILLKVKNGHKEMELMNGASVRNYASST